MALTENTEKIYELINKINSLPAAGSGSSGVNGKDGISPTISVETVTGGHYIIITDVNGTQSFFIPDGKDGQDGKDGVSGGSDGVGIVSIEQTTTSTENGGTNVITATLSNGETSTFNIKNGELGQPGTPGINGTDGKDGVDGVSVTSVAQTTTSYNDGGSNIITVTLSNGEKSTFTVKNGSKGSSGSNGTNGKDGSDGVGIVSIKQTTTSTLDGGTNIVTATLSNGETYTFNIKNGSKGDSGSNGSNATINGENTLTLNTSNGITSSQSGSTLTIGANLTNLLASGPIILKEGVDYHYGDTLPTAGTKGRLFFKRVSG